MSSTVNTETMRPAPEFLARIPPFKKGGLLPQDAQDVARNQRLRDQLIDQINVKEQAVAKANNLTYVSRCMDILHITLCFDGTNNHEPSDKLASPPTTSNVARLYHASLGDAEEDQRGGPSQAGFYRYYIQGVGTEFKEIGEFEPEDWGLKGAIGGENRVNWGLTRLIDVLRRACKEPPLKSSDAYTLVQQMGTTVTEDMLGASLFKDSHTRRQQALQAPLLELQKKIEDVHARSAIPEIQALRLYVYGFSRGAAEARAFATWLEALTQVEVNGETCYLFAGLPISIAFLGLFDTVASVGVAYVAPFAAGHMGWADGSLRLSDSERFLARCVHLVSAHEQRACFPLDSIRRKANPKDPNCRSTYRRNTFEYLYPGMHSDVGGGYPPGDQGKSLAGSEEVLSQIALHHMYHEAYQIGAPLQVPGIALSSRQREHRPWLEMSGETAAEFEVSDNLIDRFNHWLFAQDNGPLEEVMDREAALITGWRIDRYAKERFKGTSAWAHVRGGKEEGDSNDMTAKEREAFEFLHAQQLEEDAARHRGQRKPERDAATAQQYKDAEEIKHSYEKRIGAQQPIPLNTAKAFEPNLDFLQLKKAMDEFRRDYGQKWGLREDFSETLNTANVMNVLLGGLIYLTNEQDEAEEYARMRKEGEENYQRLFNEQGQPRDEEAQAIIALFDDQVHDSRAWFMNAALGEREIWSDFFRYRAIFFDDESNKRLSLLATAGQVIGVAVAVGSIGLSIKRRDPRYLVGLFLPSLGIPVFRGKVGMPEISAFDSLTNIALPMLSGLGAVREFTQDTGSVLKLAEALPLPPVLSEKNADTAPLMEVLKAQQAAEAERKAQEEEAQKKEESSQLLGKVLGTLNSMPEKEKAAWLAQVSKAAEGLAS
ncbi:MULTISPECIES: DUF2235 domain-containing protein [unclassified Pseudomonas]|uniref:T6SS phospholipase effector Tle1-like catalytic domain-containing protein n=1 Tax=unclassified Pseudomonas TaxID=196821 RepID=UPI00128AF385|nr:MULTISPECIES: DUF2235 domain-containing protein [unclassified Pseudomonas]MPQ71092.1 DUF2235 domain-containing protein [Pseudomonas sp. MWU12-2323]